MSINNLNTYLNIKDAHLRVVSGNVYAQAMNIGGINVETAHGLQSVSNTGNVTSNTLQFSNAITGFVTTANAQIGRDLVVSGNATVSKELTVSANATVADTLTISEHLIASKEATVTGNLHVTTIRSDSNVVTEYTGPHDRPLRKYPEVALTAASQGGYVTSSSTTVGTYYTWKAFDNNLSDDSSVWTTVDNIYDSNDNYAYDSDKSLGGVTGEWLKIELPNKIKPSYVRIYPRTYSPPIGNNQSPEDFKILASIDDTNWVELTSVVGWVTSATWGKWDIPSETPYKYFAIVCTRTIGAATFGIAELEYYGYEEGSGSLDTTLKSVYNVPATTGTQLEVYYDAKDLADGAVTSVADLAGGDQNGTAGSGVTVTDGAFVFNGTTNGVISDELPSTVTGAYVHSMSLWFKHSGTGNTLYTLVHIGDVNGSQSVMSDLLVYDTGKLRFGFYDNDSDTPDGIITLNQWYHVVATYSGGTGNAHSRKIYVNGKEIPLTLSGASNANSLSLPSDPMLYLGSQQGSIRLTGSIANFRLYSKALNADQVKELYDYQKDYFLGSKSQVTLYKGHLGVGVTEPSGQLELAGDERIQEYPPGPMDDYETMIPGHGVFCAYGEVPTDSIYIPGWPWWKVFDESENTAFHSKDRNYDSTTPFAFNGQTHEVKTKIVGGSEIRGEFVDLKCPYEIMVKSMKMSPREGLTGNAYLTRMPSKCIFVGSNDGTEYEILSSHSGIVYSGTAPYSANLTINATKPYKHIRLIITHLGGNGSDNGGVLNMGHLRYFGTPGPTTLDKGSLTLGRSLDVPRISRYDVDTETPRPEKLFIDYDTTVNSSLTDISGQGNHGTFYADASYSAADKAFKFDGTDDYTQTSITIAGGNMAWTQSLWFKVTAFLGSGVYSVLSFFGNKSGLSGIITSYKADRMWQDWYGNGVSFDYTFEVGQWYHAVSVYHGNTSTDPNVRSSMYLNGVKQTLGFYSAISSPMTLPTSTFYKLADHINSANTRHKGLISNVKLYNVALEPSEVKKLYNLGRTGRSMVISDTAVGIGKVPEAQLDVRGNLRVDGDILASVPYYAARQRAINSQATDRGIVYDAYVYTNYPGSFIRNSDTDGYYQPPRNGMYQVYMECIATGSGNVNIQRRTGTTVNINHCDRHWNYSQGGWESVSASALIPITDCTTQNIRIYVSAGVVWSYETYHGSAYFKWFSEIPERRQHHVT
jgi:hypothetical protein